ncbi:MAG: Smr/MutS family protein [Erysipelothrix sp.]|jgi:DNA-nicking Smr family endonuclease|nr:Smr/MutS family protein [Erysipelothrix sp.]
MIRIVDLHELTLAEAKIKLNDFMNTLASNVSEVVVIHGFHQGTILKTFVSKYQHPKIKQKLKTLNKGETIFLINI